MRQFLLLFFVVAVSAVYDNNNSVCKSLLDDNTPSDSAGVDCVAKGSKGKCENCMTGDQCGEGRFCCPFLKKCVFSGEGCYYPIANCRPSCYDSNDPTKCACSDANFPNEWVTCTNDASSYVYYGDKQDTGPITYTRKQSPDGSLMDSDQMAQGALCNHNRLRAAGGLGALQWDSCLAKFAMDYANELKNTKDCKMEHSASSRRKSLCSFSYVGENLYWAMNSRGIDEKAQRDAGWISTQAWWDEIRDYVYPKKSNGNADSYANCPKRNKQGQIGHFTQVMWADATHLGCDQALCSNSHVVVCVYGKGGNIIGSPAFSVSQRDTLNTSPEAKKFGGMPTCTAGGAPNNDGVDPDDGGIDSDNSAATQATTTTTTTTTTRAPATGGDGKCMGAWGNECKFPADTPWGHATDCNFFKNLGFSSNYCYLYSVGGTVYVDKCKSDDPDCVF